VRVGIGVGPVHASVGSRQRRRGVGVFGLVFGLMFAAMAYMLVLGIWLTWAIIALSIAGVAKLRHNESLARRMTRTLRWKMPR
jgi:hypothetical protein